MTGRYKIVLDQVISSTGTILQLAALAKFTDLTTLGAVSLVLGVHTVLNGWVRASTTEVFLHRAHTTRISDSDVYSAVLVLASLSAPVFLLTSLLPGVEASFAAAFMGISLALTMRDSMRFYHYAENRENRAIAWNIAGALVDTVGLAVLLLLGHGVAVAYLAIAAVSILMAAAQLWHARVPLSINRGRGWLQRNRHDSIFFGSEALAGGIATYAVLPVVGVLAGPTSVGILRLSQALLGPLGIAFNSLRYADIARLSVLVGAPDDVLQRKLIATSLRLAMLSALIGATLAQVPDTWVQAVLGDAGTLTQSIIFAMALQKGIAASSIPYTTALKLLGRASWTFHLRVLAILGTVIGAAVGAALGDLVTIAWAMTGTATAVLAMHVHAVRVAASTGTD